MTTRRQRQRAEYERELLESELSSVRDHMEELETALMTGQAKDIKGFKQKHEKASKRLKHLERMIESRVEIENG